jgi:hypothetical protein
MARKLRSIKKFGRGSGAAKGIFKKVGAKLRMPKSLPNRGGRAMGPPPPGVQRLPSGRFPPNYRYAGKLYDGRHWTPDLAQKYPNGVRFTRDGYPDFGPYSLHTVRFKKGFTGDRAKDNVIANREFEAPDGYTWHHHQDGRTLQLVPTDMHEAIRHGGGVARTKGR